MADEFGPAAEDDPSWFWGPDDEASLPATSLEEAPDWATAIQWPALDDDDAVAESDFPLAPPVDAGTPVAGLRSDPFAESIWDTDGATAAPEWEAAPEPALDESIWEPAPAAPVAAAADEPFLELAAPSPAADEPVSDPATPETAAPATAAAAIPFEEPAAPVPAADAGPPIATVAAAEESAAAVPAADAGPPIATVAGADAEDAAAPMPAADAGPATVAAAGEPVLWPTGRPSADAEQDEPIGASSEPARGAAAEASPIPSRDAGPDGSMWEPAAAAPVAAAAVVGEPTRVAEADASGWGPQPGVGPDPVAAPPVRSSESIWDTHAVPAGTAIASQTGFYADASGSSLRLGPIHLRHGNAAMIGLAAFAALVVLGLVFSVRNRTDTAPTAQAGALPKIETQGLPLPTLPVTTSSVPTTAPTTTVAQAPPDTGAPAPPDSGAQAAAAPATTNGGTTGRAPATTSPPARSAPSSGQGGATSQPNTTPVTTQAPPATSPAPDPGPAVTSPPDTATDTTQPPPTRPRITLPDITVPVTVTTTTEPDPTDIPRPTQPARTNR